MTSTKRTQRERVWDVLREGKPLTIERLASQAKVSVDTAWRYVDALKKAGFVTAQAQTRPATSLCPTLFNRDTAMDFLLTKDTGHDAPRLDEHGKLVLQGTKNAAMWSTLRMVPQLNASELAAYAGSSGVNVALSSARTYLVLLYKAGYLDVVEAPRPHSLAVYRLKPHMNTGPKPPQIQRVKTVWDANLGQVMMRESSEAELDCVEAAL